MSSVDKRFDKVFSDPRFMVAPKKVTKVKIDSRFKGMFKEKQFNVVAKVDKYGRKINKKDTHVLKNYYQDGSDSSSDDKSSESESDQEDSDVEDVEDSSRDRGEKKGKKAAKKLK